MNIKTGRKEVAVAGTREPLVVAPGTRAVRLVIVAETDNTNEVVVGGAEVVAALATRQGVPLKGVAGQEERLELFDVDLSDIYVDAVTGTEGVTYTYCF